VPILERIAVSTGLLKKITGKYAVLQIHFAKPNL